MSEPSAPPPVKLFVLTLAHASENAVDAVRQLEEEWGRADYRSPAYAFDATDYYEAELGSPLERSVVSFERLVPPDALPGAKHTTNRVERAFSVASRRRVNLDPGYLDTQRIVLASCKAARHKIYLADGIWADPIACYERGEFVAWPWSFRDFRDGTYRASFTCIRELYKDALRRRAEHA